MGKRKLRFACLACLILVFKLKAPPSRQPTGPKLRRSYLNRNVVTKTSSPELAKIFALFCFFSFSLSFRFESLLQHRKLHLPFGTPLSATFGHLSILAESRRCCRLAVVATVCFESNFVLHRKCKSNFQKMQAEFAQSRCDSMSHFSTFHFSLPFRFKSFLQHRHFKTDFGNAFFCKHVFILAVSACIFTMHRRFFCVATVCFKSISVLHRKCKV